MGFADRGSVVALIDGGSTDIVMGVHWDQADTRLSARTANLDAVCLLFDADGRLLERVDPRQLRNANGSVMHTGDSLTGASVWDDERIFVFLHALPDTVHALAFGVESVAGHALGDIAGASCHLSDHRMERELIQVKLAECGQGTNHCAATLRRVATGWEVRRDVAPNERSWTSLLSSARSGVRAGSSFT
jgi:tellurium resistance protein TerZ